ncbi:MAG TPA: glycosyltransferase [Bacteroidales bacterium]|nr:glycosyltransferase [Bacteroidales bacterium]
MRISVVIPLYNKRKYISQTLQSVSSQTFQPLEVIIVNDGSTDGSEELIETFNNPSLKLINQTNQGVSAARNRGVYEAEGEWIAFLDADDKWKPDYLETISKLAKIYPECDVLATSYEFENYEGTRKPSVLNKLKLKGETGILSNYFEVAYCSDPPLCSSSVAVKKEAIVAIGGFPSEIKAGEDLLTWAKLAFNYKIAFSKKALSVFIQDPSHSVTEIPTRLYDDNDFVGDELLLILKSSSGKMRLNLKHYLSLWYKMRASVYLRNSDRSKVWKNSLKSLKYNLFNYKNYLFLILSCLPPGIRKAVARIYSS